MGLAIILIVVIGVMGAGLLVFVRNDLQAVVQVNQGQEAFEAADAGVQAAKRELLSDACPESYDGVTAGAENTEDACADSKESDWSYAAVEDENVETPEEEDDYVGKELDFDGKKIDVSIRHLPFYEDDDSCDDELLPEPVSEPQQHPNCAPDAYEGDEDEREFFMVESLGESDNGDARRKVEAIYHTEDLGVPRAYYSPSDITISGNSCISDVSVFSLGKINVGGESGCDGGGKIEGEDRAYGYWQNEHNSTARTTKAAGFAAVEGVDYKQAGRDFDDDTIPEFVAEPSGDPQEPDEITFPFDYETQQGEQDEQRLNYFREEALKQEEESNDEAHFQTGGGNISDWPEDSTDSTVVYVDAEGASGGKVGWSVSGGCENPVKGTLVVDGAGLDVRGGDAFSGVTIVRGGEFESTGNSCWDGFVSADGGMKIAGTPDPFVSQEVQSRPGFYGVETWSWRELYE